jgi:hypothetical protein
VLSEFNRWFAQVSPSAAAFLASLISFGASLLVASVGFGGVLYQNWRENNRLADKLKHDTDLDVKSRTMEMKREAFLAVGEAIAAAADYLARFSDLSLARDKHQEGVRSIGAKVQGVHLIANDRTLAALIDVYERYVEYVMELEVLRIPVLVKQDEVGRADEYASRVDAAFHQTNQQFTNLKLSTTDPELLKTAMGQVQMLLEESRKAADRRAHVRLELHRMLAPFAARSLECSLRLGELSMKAVLAMRAELGVEIDAAAYESRLAKSREQTLRHFHTAIAKGKEIIGDTAL